MKVLWNCCKRSLLKNKERTIVTILGVALATGLITAIACLGMSLISSYAQYLKKTEGTAHGTFMGVAEKDIGRFQQNQNLEQVSFAKREGYSHVKDWDYLEVLSVEPNWYELNGIRLMAGHYPEVENEILLDYGMRSEWGIDISVGDEITLAVGTHGRGGKALPFGTSYQDGDEIITAWEKTYVVAGLTEHSNIHYTFYVGPGGSGGYTSMYRAYVTAGGGVDSKANEEGTYYDVALRYDQYGLKHFMEINAGLLGISLDLYRINFDWEDLF